MKVGQIAWNQSCRKWRTIAVAAAKTLILLTFLLVSGLEKRMWLLLIRRRRRWLRSDNVGTIKARVLKHEAETEDRQQSIKVRQPNLSLGSVKPRRRGRWGSSWNPPPCQLTTATNRTSFHHHWRYWHSHNDSSSSVVSRLGFALQRWWHSHNDSSNVSRLGFALVQRASCSSAAYRQHGSFIYYYQAS